MVVAAIAVGVVDIESSHVHISNIRVRSVGIGLPICVLGTRDDRVTVSLRGLAAHIRAEDA